MRSSSIRTFRTFLFLLLVLPLIAAAGAAGAGSGEFPKNLAIFTYFTDTALDALAEKFVNNYVLAYEEAEAYLFSGTSNIAMNAFRGNHDDYPYDVHPALLTAARLASKYPGAVRWFYGQNAEGMMDRMVKKARARELTETEIREMFDLYARAAEAQAKYLDLATEKLDPRKDKAIVDNYNIYRGCRLGDATYEYGRCARATHVLQTALAAKYGLPFDGDGFHTWLFGRRRYNDGGAALVRTFAELIRDAAARAGKVPSEGRPSAGLPPAAAAAAAATPAP